MSTGRAKSDILLSFLFAILLLSLFITAVQAAPVPENRRLGGGVVINEILADPSIGGDTACDATEPSAEGFDTNSDLCVEQEDEYIELYNMSDEDIEIGGWSLWTKGEDQWFTFTTGTEIPAYSYVVVTADWIDGQDGETGTLNGSPVFSADEGRVFDNDGDNVVLLDPDFNQYIQIVYTGEGATETQEIDQPTVSGYDGFPPNATRLGAAENFGVTEDGVARVRKFAGDTVIVHHDDLDGRRGNPGDHYTAVSFRAMDVFKQDRYFLLPLVILLFITAILWRRHHAI